ncbi:MAG: hypothetical protein U0359_24435 [Byssovorax sp.]
MHFAVLRLRPSTPPAAGMIPPAAAALAVSALGALVLVACVPEGPATTGAGSTAKPAVTAAPVRPKTAPSGPLITAPFEDAFDRVELGPDYNALGPAWKLQNGKLCARGARNKGIWLNRRLPVNARIEFDAYAESPDGDLKAELWGDGVSGATGTSYTNATSYLTILGGWKNTKHVLARLDEHGDDRLEIDIDKTADDERQRAVSPGQVYHFKVERSDAKTVSWSVNNVTYFDFADPEPLTGAGHEHVGFNDWDAPVCFDNLKIVPL